MSAFQWTALVFALIWITWKILDRGVDSFAILLQRFRHDGNTSRRSADVPSASPAEAGWGPFAVDASNGPLGTGWCHWCGATLTDRSATKCPAPCSYEGWRSDRPHPSVDALDALRLRGLVEFHRVPEGIVPPKSRPMRRTIH